MATGGEVRFGTPLSRQFHFNRFASKMKAHQCWQDVSITSESR